MHSIAWNVRVKELSRMPKAQLARIYRLNHPGLVWTAAPLEKWNKDELVNGILDAEFPTGGLVEAVSS